VIFQAQSPKHSQTEIRKQLSFQEKFRNPVWFAIIPRTGLQYYTFYWISLNHIRETIVKKYSCIGPFYPIPIKACTPVGWKDGIGKLLF